MMKENFTDYLIHIFQIQYPKNQRLLGTNNLRPTTKLGVSILENNKMQWYKKWVDEGIYNVDNMQTKRMATQRFKKDLIATQDCGILSRSLTVLKWWQLGWKCRQRAIIQISCINLTWSWSWSWNVFSVPSINILTSDLAYKWR